MKVGFRAREMCTRSCSSAGTGRLGRAGQRPGPPATPPEAREQICSCALTPLSPAGASACSPQEGLCPRKQLSQSPQLLWRNGLERMGAHCSGKGPQQAPPAPGFTSISASQSCEAQAPECPVLCGSQRGSPPVHLVWPTTASTTAAIYRANLQVRLRGPATRPRSLSQRAESGCFLVFNSMNGGRQPDHSSDALHPDPSGNFLSGLLTWMHLSTPFMCPRPTLCPLCA